MTDAQLQPLFDLIREAVNTPNPDATVTISALALRRIAEELAEFREDKARLDYLEEHGSFSVIRGVGPDRSGFSTARWGPGEFMSWREAIDAARSTPPSSGASSPSPSGSTP